MATIKNITCKTVVRPMRTTFATARGSKTCATSVIVTVTCDDGTTGIGEVPTSFVVPQETVDVIKKTILQSDDFLCGQPLADWAALAGQLQHRFPDFHMTCSGLEAAMFRAYLASVGSDEITWWGKQSKSITSDITIPFVPDVEVLRPWIERAVRGGFDIYKVKVSGDLKRDAAFVRSVTEILSESDSPYTIRLDGNQGFSCDSALRLLDKLDEKIELFEQPLKYDDYEGMKQLCRNAPVPMIADETVFTVEDARRVIEYGLAHGINIKIAKSGITPSREIIKLAQKANLTLMIGCMTETMVGLSTALYCAMGTGAFDYIDLDSVHFLHHRKRYRDILIDGPAYHLGEHA
jgi:L-alanine-DL-glutamate epimerase-like enolase superfamily enzyme